MKIAAHRGASGDFPENTLAAYRGALEADCRAFECDVRRTKDGVLVLSHDPDLKRTAGADAVIGELTYDELAAHDVGKGERVPRFADLLSLLPETAELHVDVKQDGVEAQVLDAVRGRERWKNRTTFASADPAVVRCFKTLEPGLRLGYQPRTTPIDEAFEIAVELAAESLRLNMERLTPEWIERAHAKGIQVYIYTVNSREEFLRMKDLNVDLVFSSNPSAVGKS